VIQSAIEALKSGAFDYLTKPCGLDDLISKATRAASRKKEQERHELIAKILNS
jgi:DNA-binding NtrC family response regulator